MVKKPLTQIAVYNRFIRARDLALEKIHSNTQLKITDALNIAFKHALMYVGFYLDQIDINSGFTLDTKNRLKKLDVDIEWIFDSAIPKISHSIERMRKQSFLLASAGEGEAIGRATGKQTRTDVSRETLHKVAAKESPSGGNFQHRIKLYLNNVKRDIMSSVEHGIIVGGTKIEILDAVFRSAIPKKRSYAQPKKILRDPKKALQEADKTKVARVDVGYVTPEDWVGLVDAYKEDYLPQTRGPEDVVATVKTDDDIEKEVYAWELERDVTQSFVEDVRAGQIDAAKKNGIIDFIWIAIVDDRTDDCCLWRDGLTTSQIEEALGGAHSDDECDAISPPAHFNCRCTLAPALDGIDDLVPEDNAAEFDQWLNEKV